MKNIFTKLSFILLIGFIVVTITACTPSPLNPNNNNPIITNSNNLSASSDIKKFNNVNEMKDFLSLQASSQNYDSLSNSLIRTAGKGLAMDSVAESAPTAQATGGDYSSTNVQVQGVDEADFVKNDGNYIYMISNNNLVIISGDGKNSKIVSQTSFVSKDDNYQAPTVRDLFLNKNQVIVFVDKYEKSFYFEKYNIQPMETYKEYTIAYIYDVTDRTKPVLAEQFKISGYYYSSRMINNIVYAVTQENLYDWRYYGGPMVEYAKSIVRPEIYYFDNPDNNYQMNTITSINVDSKKVIDSKSFMLGYGDTLMVSENNIYIAYQKQTRWCFGWRCTTQTNTDSRDRFMKVVVPLLESDIKVRINTIIDQNLGEEEEWNQISQEFTKFYTELYNDTSMQNKYKDMFVNIEDALNEYDAKKALDDSKTVIHKIAINNGNIEYKTKGEVDGRLLNQYSMDEKDNNLRLATSINMWLSKGSVQYNNVYILDDNMKVIGSLTNLAKNESIYSTRFIGDKLYMVTFRQIDPFFVIDLSDATNPTVLGYLKIPGYSSYLHPISDTLILGVGKETGTNEYGGVTTKGVKISLFDVSDFNNPKEISKYEIGLQGTDTPISYDPKAFLYSPTKNLIVIPVTEIVDRVKSGQYDYRTSVMNGAYVFSIKDNELNLLSKIVHSSSETQYYYWLNSATVTRSLYMDNTLYTISDKYVKANDIANDLKDLVTIDLPTTPDNYPVPIVYADSTSGSTGVATVSAPVASK